MIEHTLRVTAPDEATAARVGEILARVMVSLSAENVEVSAEVERYVRVCHHVHGEQEHGEVES
jgi:hypothetical protein